MRNFFLLVTTMAGAWGGLKLAVNWGSQFTDSVVSAGMNPLAGMLAAPGVLVGAILGLVIGALVVPKVH